MGRAVITKQTQRIIGDLNHEMQPEDRNIQQGLRLFPTSGELEPWQAAGVRG